MTRREQWDSHPLESFSKFIRTADFAAQSKRPSGPAPVSDASAATYTYMFGKFTRWMAEHGKVFSSIDQADLALFIAHSTDGQRDLNSKIAHKYLRLLERCYDHLRTRPNPATHAIRAIDARQFASDAPTIALAGDELARFLEALPDCPPRGTGTAAGWKRRRDRAMLVVLALSGLRVAETIGLLVEEVGRQASIDHGIELDITPEAKHATSYKHTTILPAAGVPVLQAWLDERAALRIPGRLVFPANLVGGPLHKTTVYRLVRATFERAGVAAPHAGGRTLRNTFAVQKLNEGTAAAELAVYLGLARARSTDPYRHARVGTQEDPS